MALPIINQPTYTITLPLSQKEVQCRQILAGEHKALLEAASRKDDKVMGDTLIRVMQACTTGCSVASLDYPDAEYLFLRLYAIGIDNQLRMQCQCQECKTSFGITIPVADIMLDEVKEPPTIDCGSGVSVKMKYPTFALQQAAKNDDALLYAMVDCVYDEHKTYTPGIDFSEEELKEFIDRLPASAVEQMIAFIEDMPAIEWARDLECPSCKAKGHLAYRGLSDFLA